MKKLLLPLVVLLSLSSCAYVQTHKNLQEFFVNRQGDELTAPLKLGNIGGSWYVCAKVCTGGVTKKFPTVYDEILLNGNNEPHFQPVGTPGAAVGGMDKPHTAAWPISSGTAMVLMREDGYATLDTLADEMLRNRAGRLDVLPRGMQFYPVKAQIAGTEKAAYLLRGADTKPELNLAETAVVQAERVLIDWPLTAAYNCAIPFMAPVVFFYQFVTED